MIVDPSFYAVALPAVVLYGFSKGGFSGVGLLSVPLMSMVMSPVQAAAILLPVLLVQDVVTIYAYRHDWDRQTLIMTLPGALVGIGLGAATAAIVSNDLIRLAIGCLALAFCLNYWLGQRRGAEVAVPHASAPAAVLSTIAGYTSFVLHAGGPPFNMYALPRLIEPVRFVGTAGVFFGLLNIIKVPPYFLLGQFNVNNLLLSAVLVPVAVLGNVAGIWLVRRLPKEKFFSAVYALTALVGAKLIVDGLGLFSH